MLSVVFERLDGAVSDLSMEACLGWTRWDYIMCEISCAGCHFNVSLHVRVLYFVLSWVLWAYWRLQKVTVQCLV